MVDPSTGNLQQHANKELDDPSDNLVGDGLSGVSVPSGSSSTVSLNDGSIVAIQKVQEVKTPCDPPAVKVKRGRPPKLAKTSQATTTKVSGKKTGVAPSSAGGDSDSGVKKEAGTPIVSPFSGMSYILK